jgi:hypothetical protein
LHKIETWIFLRINNYERNGNAFIPPPSTEKVYKLTLKNASNLFHFEKTVKAELSADHRFRLSGNENGRL